MILNLKVDGQAMIISENNPDMVEKTLNYVKCVFDFVSDEWNGTIKTAYFRNEKTGKIISQILQNNECMIPHEALSSEGCVSFSVAGEKENYRITSNAVSFFNHPTVYGGEPSDPTPTEYEQIIALSLETMKIAQQVRTDADNGKFNGETGATGPQGPPGKDAVTDTELSVESNNAVANSTVAKVLDNGNLIGFAKVDSLEKLNALSSRYPEGIPENAFLILYVTQDLSYTDPDTQFTFPPGLYLLTQQGEIRLCPDTESVNAHFESIDELMSYWYTIAGSKANVSDLDKVKQDLGETTDTADEALTIAKGRNRALCFFTYQELDNWLNGDFQREDGKTKADLQTGDNLYIVEVGVPDYWWDGEQIRPLETQKVDLSEYAEKDYVNEKVEQEVSVPNSDIANYLEVADILGIWKNATAGRTSFANLFENANVKTVPMMDTSSGTNFAYMFQGCTKLETVPLFDTSKATTFLNMFYGCTSLKSVPAFNTAKLTNSFGMVRECTSLVSFKGIDISKVINCNGMFYGCTSLEEVEIDMSSVTFGNYLFYNCESLRTVKTLDFSNITSLSGQFYQCVSLESVVFTPGSIKVSLSMAQSSKLNADSVASLFEGLADLTDSETQTLTLHKDVNITQAQADGAVAKNWNIVGGTVNG